MADQRYVTCPLCGFEFEPTDTLCEHGCPLRAACGLIRCPGCEYEFPQTPKAVSWLRRLFGRPQGAAAPAGMLTVRELAPGERAEVVAVSDLAPGRSNALAVFGLVPGSGVRLIQRRPSFVLQVGETVLALEAEVAGSIVVRAATPAADGAATPRRAEMESAAEPREAAMEGAAEAPVAADSAPRAGSDGEDADGAPREPAPLRVA
ncbi:MAG: FeoA family protein [Thermoanaerobaculia bacterium]